MYTTSNLGSSEETGDGLTGIEALHETTTDVVLAVPFDLA